MRPTIAALEDENRTLRHRQAELDNLYTLACRELEGLTREVEVRGRERDEARGRVDHLTAAATNAITDLEKLAALAEAAVAKNEDATLCGHVILKRIAPIPAKAATENFAALASVANSLRQQAKTLREHLERHEREASRT